MKKRFSCIALVLLMLVPMMLTGCKSTGYHSSTGSSATPYTITIWCITDDSTTQDGIESAQKALNDITEYDFNTHIELRLFSAEEYENEVRDALETMFSYYEEPEETESVQTTINEDGEAEAVTESKVYVPRDEIVYPEAKDYQCDILLIDSVDFFNELISNEDIQVLDGELVNKSKIINKFVNPVLLSAGRSSMQGATYAVANNGIVGDAEYMLIRRDVCDALGYAPNSVHTVTSLSEFASAAAGYGSVVDTYGITPLSESIFDGDTFFGSYVGYQPSLATNAMPKVLGTVTKYTTELGLISSMKSSGRIVSGELTEGMTAPAILVRGNSADIQQYEEDYYVNFYRNPTATNENTCSSMWAVSTYTKDISRCMEIVSYMQTNVDFINAFYYGKSGVNYEKDPKTDMVTILNDDYKMDSRYINQFLLYQNDTMTEKELLLSNDNWKLAKDFNTNLLPSPYLTFSCEFTPVYYEDEDTMTEYLEAGSTSEFIQKLRDISTEYGEKIAAYTGADIENYAISLGNEMAADPTVKAASSKKYTNSPFARYIAWYQINNADESGS